MSTRKLIKGDRYRAGLWKLEDSCYEGHVRMPNAKFMIRTYRCTQGEAVAKFDSWVEAEGLDLAEDGAREACEGSIDDGMGTARRPLNREERRAMERRDREGEEAPGAKGGIGGRCRATVTGYGEGRDGNAEGIENGRAEDGGRGDKGSGDGADQVLHAHAHGRSGDGPVMVFRNEGDANDMMRALEQVAKVTSPDTVYDVMEAPFKEAI